MENIETHLQSDSIKVSLSRNDEADHVSFTGVSTDTNVLDGWVDLQKTLHLTKTDVLPALQLHQVLLPVQ